jgi:glutamate racemase
VQIPADEGGEGVEHMEKDALAPQQGGRADSMVISCTEYEFLSGAHQRMDRLEECFANMEKQPATQTEILKAILEQLPAVGASFAVPHGEQ